MRRGLAAVVLVLLGVLVAACGEAPQTSGGTASSVDSPTTLGTSRSPSPTSRSASEPPTAPGSSSPVDRTRGTGTRIRVAASSFGPVLHDGSGQAIYVFDRETSSRPACYRTCADAWPPVLTQGRPRAIAGARPGLLGTTERRDGSMQVTYRGHPLYFYAHEGKYEVLCHNITEYGGLWLAVRADGRPAPT